MIRRICIVDLRRSLARLPSGSTALLRFYSGGRFLNIGDVKLPIATTHLQPERVPAVLSDGCRTFFPMTHETRAAMRWMAQKELLGQDMCIVGEPGPLRRWLVQVYCHYARRETQLLVLSRDTTDADIKQRKEILNGSLTYAHQAAVQAALNGQVLILEGLERAERNVLPIINNLLENREMHLDDGRSIIHPQRYDELLRAAGTANLDHLGLLRCSEHFRVVALTVPVPKFPGNPLDPPLRSRFQCFYLHPQSDPTDSILASETATPAGAALAKLRHALQGAEVGGSDSDRKLHLPALGSCEAIALLNMCRAFPKEDVAALLPMFFPYELLAHHGLKADVSERITRTNAILRKYSMLAPHVSANSSVDGATYDALHKSVLTQLSQVDAHTAVATFATGETVKVPIGSNFGSGEKAKRFFASLVRDSTASGSSSVAMTGYHVSLLTEMILAHACGRHALLVGDSGCGKSTLLQQFCDVFGYPTEVMHLFADMSTRDLLQRRVTCSQTGNTTWELSPLMLAAKLGRVAVLDGIDNMPPGMLNVLQELLIDRSITLVDGTLFLSPESYATLKAQEGVDDTELAARRVFAVHPSFRVVATAKMNSASKSSSSGASWLPTDIASMFAIVCFRPMPVDCAACVLQRHVPAGVELSSDVQSVVTKLLQLQRALRSMLATDPKVPQLTLRQAIHVTKYTSTSPHSDASLGAAVESALLLPLVGSVTRTQLRDVMQKCGIDPVAEQRPVKSAAAAQLVDFKKLHGAAANALGTWLRGGQRNTAEGDAAAQVGLTRQGNHFVRDEASGAVQQLFVDASGMVSTVFKSSRLYTAEEMALVPHVQQFVPNPQQDRVLQWIGRHMQAPSTRILLVGTQGVGKNKVVDFFLMSTGTPRHYIQLHRDTTVGSLTITPTVVAGKVVWDDSPLVKAVRLGHVLVVDEIDKASVEVVQILKGLVDDKEMFLSDGRRILSQEAAHTRAGENIVPMHPDFKIIVLANPPGYPFHGNDFYRVCGDLFDTYVLQNPDALSQLKLLTSLAPNIPPAVLTQLIEAFGKLIRLCEDGALTYPFSLRELIAVVKHIRRFPQDGLYQALNNVFNFDVMDENTMNHVRRVLHESLRSDALSTLRNSTSPATALSVQRGAVTAANVLEEGDHVLPCHVTSLSDPNAWPYISWATLEPSAIVVESVSAEAMAAAVPRDFSEMRLTATLPFLRAAGSSILGSVVTAKDLLVTLYTNDDLARQNSVRLTAMLLPGRDLVLHATHLGISSHTAIHITVPLSALSSSASAATVSLHSCDPILTTTLVGAQRGIRLFDAASIGATVSLVDASSGRLVFLDPLQTAAARQLEVAEDEDDMGEELPHKSDVVPSVPLASAPQLCVMALSSTLGVLNRHTITIDSHVDVVAYSFEAANALYIVPDAAHYGGDLLQVTLPGILLRAHFFTPRHAHVVIDMKSAGGVKHAILKTMGPRSVLRGQVTLKYLSEDAALALGLDKGATFVGLTPVRTYGVSAPRAAHDDNALSVASVQLADITGAVVAGGSGGAVGSVSDTGDVDLLKLPQASSSSATGRSTRYDHHLGQVLTPDGRAVDVKSATIRHLPASATSPGTRLASSSGSTSLTAAVSPNGDVSVFERNYDRLTKEFESWKSFMDTRAGSLGAPPSPKELDMWYNEPRKEPSGSLKHGKEDPDNTPHVGGNTWAGGTGGTDTAGLGGLVGPYRLDKGHTVHQVDPERKKQVPQHIIDEAKKMGQEALKQRLKEIGMTEEDNRMYNGVLEQVRGPIVQLQNMLSTLKAHDGERTWAKHQSDGVWDDAKLVEGITGERNIYKRRVESQDADALRHKKKKRLLFVLDVSASMYRFNGMDQRLNRLIESATMVMEALIGQEDRIDYALVGHNGDSDELPLVDFGKPPANKKERMDVCLKMVAYAQYCWAGDNTVNAMRKSISTVTAEPADSYFVFVVSDANLQQYSITPDMLTRIIRHDDRVHMFCIFVASFGAQSSQLQRRLPAGHGFECFDTKQLPLIMNQIFSSTNLLGNN